MHQKHILIYGYLCNDAKTSYEFALSSYFQKPSTIVQGLAASFALGSMCILTGLVFMVDATWSVLDIFYMPKK